MSLKSRNKVSVNFSMSSMTDIVFLLLIFFIVLSTMVSAGGQDVDYPTGSNRTPSHPKISVTITKDLDYFINRDEVAKSELERGLLEKKQATEQSEIILRVDKDVPVGETISFLNIAKRNGFDIVIATKPAPETENTP